MQKRTLLSEIEHVFKLTIAQGSFCFDTPCLDDYGSYSYGKSARFFLHLISSYKQTTRLQSQGRTRFRSDLNHVLIPLKYCVIALQELT